MHKFKEHDLHSGTKKGPVVTNPKQAVAIALSESKQSKRPHSSVADMDRTVVGGPKDAVADAASDIARGVGMQPTVAPTNQRTPPSNACGFGHSVAQRVGNLRLSGSKGAHRIGAK